MVYQIELNQPYFFIFVSRRQDEFQKSPETIIYTTLSLNILSLNKNISYHYELIITELKRQKLQELSQKKLIKIMVNKISLSKVTIRRLLN